MLRGWSVARRRRRADIEAALIAHFQPSLNRSPVVGSKRLSLSLSAEDYRFLEQAAASHERTIAAEIRYWIKQKRESSVEAGYEVGSV